MSRWLVRLNWAAQRVMFDRPIVVRFALVLMVAGTLCAQAGLILEWP